MEASEETYTPRLVDLLLDDLLAELPAILVTGPRAAGKTTTISRRAATVVRLDREAESGAFRADPDSALRGLPEPVLLDEWQAVPGVLGAVKRAVDADPRPSRFLVTGSANAELDGRLWPGTGRLVRLPLHPMAVREQRGLLAGATLLDKLAHRADLTVPDETPDLRGYVELALASGYPYPALRLGERSRAAWLESYVDGLLSRDVEQVHPTTTRPRDAGRLRAYFEAYALSSAAVSDHKTIYDAAGIRKETAASYEGLLARVFVAEQIPAWSSNRLKRLVRQPKRYLVDAALVAAALRLDVDGVLRDGTLLGRVIETFVAAQLRPEVALSTKRPRLHHLRSEQGRHEIDLLAELGGGDVIGIEIKATSAPQASDAKHLAWLRDELGKRFLAGVVLHTGPRVFELGDRLLAAPISVLWG